MHSKYGNGRSMDWEHSNEMPLRIPSSFAAERKQPDQCPHVFNKIQLKAQCCLLWRRWFASRSETDTAVGAVSTYTQLCTDNLSLENPPDVYF